MSALANFILKEMQQRGWDQKDLSAKSRIPKATISRLLNGQVSDPELPTFVALSTALEVPLWKLLEQAGYEVERPTDPVESDRQLARQIEATPEIRPIVQWLFDLDMDDRAAVMAFVEALKRRRGDRGGTPG
jgi:transcriptional regulator with XRE-family HTH domain